MPKKKRRERKSHYITGTHISPKAGECAYRSGWERRYMEYLDENHDVKSYLYEGVIVMYINNVRSGKLCKYFPDFLVEYTDGRKILVEIKPAKRVNQLKVQKKLIAAKQWCDEHEATLEVVTEVELKKLGLFK